MNIYEIISEATPVDAATRQSRLARAQASRVVPAATAAPKSSNVMDLVKKLVASGQVSEKTVNTTMMQKIGNAWPVVKFLGFAPLAYTIWQQYTAVDQLLAAKQISPADAEAGKRIIITQGVAAVMATGAFGKLIKIVTTLSGIRWFIRGIGLVSSTVSLGASIAVTIATEAGIIWLQQYLATKEGQEQLAYTVLYFIDPGTVWLWNAGPGKIFGEWKDISDKGAEKVKVATGITPKEPFGTTPDASVPASNAAPSTPVSTSGQGAQPASSNDDWGLSKYDLYTGQKLK